MVVASKVKARKDSTNLAALSLASKRVAEATGQVIATSRACHADAENEAVDLEKLSVHQSKKLEMEIQIKVLQLETQLERERKKLFSLRKLQYSNNNDE
jgi:huntingtin interacting protein 1